MRRTKKQVVHVNANASELHIETELGVINIRLGRRDSIGEGHEVESIEVLADRSAGEPDVDIDLDGTTKVKSVSFRLVRLTDDEQQTRNHAARNTADENEQFERDRRTKEDPDPDSDMRQPGIYPVYDQPDVPQF